MRGLLRCDSLFNRCLNTRIVWVNSLGPVIFEDSCRRRTQYNGVDSKTRAPVPACSIIFRIVEACSTNRYTVNLKTHKDFVKSNFTRNVGLSFLPWTLHPQKGDQMVQKPVHNQRSRDLGESALPWRYTSSSTLRPKVRDGRPP